MGFSRQAYWSGLPFPSPVDHILSDLSSMTRPSWVAPRAWLNFIELDKAVVGRNDAKAETPVLWPPHAKSWLIGKDSDAGRDWGQEEKGTTEDKMAGWHHWLDGHESEWTPGVGDGQGGLACCDSWGRKESDMTERLIWSEATLLNLVSHPKGHIMHKHERNSDRAMGVGNKSWEGK